MQLRQVVRYALFITGAALLVAGVAPKLMGGHFNRPLVIAAPIVLMLAVAVRRRAKTAP
jgi:membrane protein implicated in regulation of membrane protease activity